MEIVSEPDLRSADDVAAYMEEIRRLVRWLGVSDGNMEEGSLRCDVNISVRKKAKTADLREPLRDQKCKLHALCAQGSGIRIETTSRGTRSRWEIDQETRGFDAFAGEDYHLREKENAHDYRYFPEPDLPPVVLSEAYLQAIQKKMPTLPQTLELEFQTIYGLPAYDAALLTQEKDTAFYFLQLAQQRWMQASPQNPSPI